MAKGTKTVKVQETAPSVYNDGIKEYSLADIANMQMPTFYKKKDRIVNAQRAVYYDTVIYKPGTITRGQIGKFFTLGQDEKASVANDASLQYDKDLFHTNMDKSGEFPKDTTFILERAQVDLFVMSSKLAANGWNLGKIVNTAIDPAANTHAADVLYRALSRQFNLRFERGGKEQLMIEGLLRHFPTAQSATGAFGAERGGFIQNGPATAYDLRFMRPQVLEGGDSFKFELEPLADSLDITASGQWIVITTELVGLEITDLYA